MVPRHVFHLRCYYHNPHPLQPYELRALQLLFVAPLSACSSLNALRVFVAAVAVIVVVAAAVAPAPAAVVGVVDAAVVDLPVIAAAVAVEAEVVERLGGWDEAASYMDDEQLQKDDNYRLHDARFHDESQKSFCDIDREESQYVLVDCISAQNDHRVVLEFLHWQAFLRVVLAPTHVCASLLTQDAHHDHVSSILLLNWVGLLVQP